MEEIVLTMLLTALEQVISNAVEQGIDYVVRKVVDNTGRVITKIVYDVDTNGDGVADSSQELISFDLLIPDLSDGYCLCNDGEDIGIGLPQLQFVDGLDVVDYIGDNDIVGNGNGYLVDFDGDGDKDDVLLPLSDFNGDGVCDWGLVVDRDDNGLPDAASTAPFYPVGSDEYSAIVEMDQNNSGGIIMMSADGTMAVYDPLGQLTEETYNEAYQLWYADNGAMVKPFDYYTVSEALLLVIAAFATVSLFARLFKRRHYL